VKAHQADHSVVLLCKVLGLSRSGYYAWLKRKPGAHAQRDRELLEIIKEEHLASRGIYGAPRIHEMLKRRGQHVSRKRVARLMREAGLCGVTRRKRWRTTTRDPRARPAPDLVDRDFTAEGPDHLWVADITHVPTQGAALYLAVVLDVWSRKVVGWANGTEMPAELVIAALDMALARRRPENAVVHHSDQGSQYTSAAFRERCARAGVRVSMGSVGDCFDNAMAESFFATLEAELLDLVPLFDGPAHAECAIFEFIEGFYNTRRLHKELGQRSPVEFEAQAVPGESPSRPQVASLPPDPPRPSPIRSARA